MVCPHCYYTVSLRWKKTEPCGLDDIAKKCKIIHYSDCPHCKKMIVELEIAELAYYVKHNGGTQGKTISREMIYPAITNFVDMPEIPKQYSEDFLEAQKILYISPKASAALTRRTLQQILREEYNIKRKFLSEEIKEFCSKSGIPSQLSDSVDAIRLIGNFAAHPSKDLKTGEIVSVEEGEAEWLLEILNDLMDFTFIQPKKLERRKKELNVKLEQLGKPLLK